MRGSFPVARTGLLSLALICSASAQNTNWAYSFGTSNGVWTSNASTTNFLPPPSPGGGTARVRVGSGGGSFTLTNPSSGSVLVGAASTSGSVNIFSISGISTPTNLFTLRFRASYTAGSSGAWSLYAGSGATYSNNSGPTTAQNLVGLRVLNSNSVLQLQRRTTGSGGSWQVSSLPQLSNNVAYNFVVYANNSTNPITYGATNTLATNAWDLWINGAKAGSGFVTMGLPAGTNIESFMFVGDVSAANQALITVDNVSYANFIDTSGGPPTINSFTPAFGNAGTVVTVSGSGFGTNPAIAFNGTAAVFTSASDTQITVPVPLGATTGKITVDVTGQPRATSSADFVVGSAPPPAVTATPSSITVPAATNGFVSPSTNYLLVASNLTGNLVIGPTTNGFEVSTNNSEFVPSLTLVPVASNIITNIFVRVSTNAVLGAVGGSISNAISGGSFLANTPSVTGSVVWPPIPTSVVVNKYVNDAPATTTGTVDRVQLLVVASNTAGSTLDMRGMIIKDFSSSMAADTGGKYIFASNNPVWASVAAGTIIAVSAGDSEPEDLDPSDYYMAVNLSNTSLFTDGTVGGGFNIGTTDMVMVKAAGSGVDGVVGGIHALAAGTAGSQFNAFTGSKLIASATTLTGFGVIASNSTSSLPDYGVAGAAASTDALGNVAAASLNFTNWNNASNQAYILSLRSSAPPVISSTNAASGTVGVAFSYNITASNSPTSYGASNLPSGLSVNSSSGLISGTPSAAGVVASTIFASNSAGIGSNSLNITIAKGTPVISNAPTASGLIQGQSLSNSILSGGVASVPGLFSWTTPAFVPQVGTSSNGVTFTPTDTNNYKTNTTNVNVTVTAASAPFIGADPAVLSGFTTVRPSASTNQSTIVNGTNLTGNLIITPPPGWQISTNSGSNTFGSSTVTLFTNPSGVVSNTEIFVRLAGTNAAATNYSNIPLSLVSGGKTNNVLLSGSVIDPPPVVSVSTNALFGFSTPLNVPSAFQSFTAFGTNLTSNITVTAPAGLAISFTNDNSGISSPLTITNPAGGATNRIVFVRMTGAAVGAFGNNVTLVSGSGSNSVAVSGEVLAPVITVSTNSLPPFSSSTNIASAAQSFFAQGTNLSANIAVAAPAGFSVAFTTNIADFTNALTLTNSAGTATNREIFVRMNASATTNSLGPTNVVLSSLGATSRTVTVSGAINAAQPSLTASPSVLSNFVAVTGTSSPAQSYALSGSNLSTVSVTAPAGFQVALTNTNSAFGSSVSPVPSGGVLNTNIFVRVSAAATTNANLTGDIANVSGTASTNVALQARVVPAPTLSAVPIALSNFSTIVGVVSTNQSFTLSANNLLGPVNLSVSNGYEMSLSANSGFAANLTVAAVSASDNAGNYTAATWTNGANGGTGFGPWVIAANSGTGFAGVFVGNPNAAGIATDGQFGTNAFGMYANPGPSGAFANADRSFPALLVGQTFSFQWGVNWDSDVGNKGFNIYAGGAGGTQLVNVNQSGFPGIITVNGANAISNYGSNAMTWSFTMTTPTNLLVSSTGRDGTTNIAFTTNITVAASPDAFRWYVSAMGAGDQRQPYFNNLRIAYTGGNISNLPVYVRIATNAPPAETTNSLLSRVTVSSTAVPQPGLVATAASSQTYNAYNDFYLSPTAAGWTGATNPSAAGAAWGYYMGNVNGNGGFPLKVGSYLTSGQLYKLSSFGPLSSDPTKYSTSLWDNTGGAGFPRYQANIPGWSTSLGSFSTPWFDGAPGFGTSLSNAIWLQSSYLGNTQPSPAGPAEGIASVLTWTAPVAGSYSFSGRFVAGNQPANSAAVSIVDSLGGTNLARTVLSSSSTQTISFTKSYNAGDTVQFQVGNNFSTGNAVGLQINVTPATESSNVFAYVDLSGTVANRPSISLSTNAVSGLSATNGYPGVSTNFAVSGRSLTNDIVITVTPATNYQISADNSVFTNTLTLARSNGIVSSNTIYVRIAASAPVSTNPNSLPGNVAFVSPSASTNLSLSGRVFEDVSIPVVETGTNALAGLATVEGTASASTNFTVNGRYLRGNIVVTAPANFAVSTNNLNFAAGVQLPPGVDRIVPPTPVFVRIAENASAGAVTGNVVLNSSNLPAPANVLVSGTVTNWSVANPYGIRVTNPVDFVSTDKGNFTFSGQFGTALDSAMLSWFNLANGVSNGFTGNANRTWSTSVPLDAGINTLVFSGQYLTNAGTTNTAGDTAGDGAYGPPGGWVSGDNGGFGFAPWQLYSEDGLSALYRADVWSATNMNVSAFYGFAFESIVGGLASAHRPFAADLQAPGGSFSVYFDNNNVQPQGSVGLQLVSSNKTPLFTFSAVNDGSGPAYQIGNKTNSAIRPGWAYTQSGLLLRFEMTSSNGYVFTASGSNFTNTNTGTILSLPVAGVTFFADGAGPAPESNFYVGQMQQRRTIYQLETVSTVAPDVERTSPPTSAYKIWAQSFGLDPAGNGAPGADPDKDGYTNDMEFAFGTNPVVATTRPMLQARQSGADLVVSFLARNAGVSYAVLQKSNLAAASPAWADVAVSLVKDADQSGIADPVNYTRRSFTVPATGQNFYRVRATVSQ